ncbi:MAG: hypothetical protein HQK87_10880 [Nitrospinae bacterium]|nr:hypothetical protein [Nitrospinota bacterium]
MMRVAVALLKGTALVTLLALALGGAVAVALYRDTQEFMQDARRAYAGGRIALYRRGLLDRLDPEEVRQVYQSSCYRQCHGEAVMLTAVLSPAGWIQVVERMRVKEGVDIGGREADAIIQYLEEEYPAVRSPYTYAVRRQTHDAVWRNDDGAGDIYLDVIYATPEYLRSIGMSSQIDQYGAQRDHVFIVSFTAHEGAVPPYDLDRISALSVDGGKRVRPSSPWELRFETADRHHYEALVRFSRSGDGEARRRLELFVETVGGAPVRSYAWELPLAYPPEVTTPSGVGSDR